VDAKHHGELRIVADMTLANYRTTADAGIPLLLHAVNPCPRAAECGRWALVI
jgi:hypothetical protein